MYFRQLLNPATSSFTYLLGDPRGGQAVLIDPTSAHVERDRALMSSLGVTTLLVLLTYTNRDRVSAVTALRSLPQVRVASALGLAGGADLQVRGGDRLAWSRSTIGVLDTPGFTADSVSYHVGRRVFTGGALSIRRCGGPDGACEDPGTLYDSVVGSLFALPDETLVYPAHHQGGVSVTTIGAERLYNPDLAERDRGAFVAKCRTRRRYAAEPANAGADGNGTRRAGGIALPRGSVAA